MHMNETEEHRKNTIPHSSKIHSVTRHLGQQQYLPDISFKRTVVQASVLFFSIPDEYHRPT